MKKFKVINKYGNTNDIFIETDKFEEAFKEFKESVEGLILYTSHMFLPTKDYSGIKNIKKDKRDIILEGEHFKISLVDDLSINAIMQIIMPKKIVDKLIKLTDIQDYLIHLHDKNLSKTDQYKMFHKYLMLIKDSTEENPDPIIIKNITKNVDGKTINILINTFGLYMMEIKENDKIIYSENQALEQIH